MKSTTTSMCFKPQKSTMEMHYLPNFFRSVVIFVVSLFSSFFADEWNEKIWRYHFFTQIWRCLSLFLFVFSPFSSKQLIFFLYFLRSNFFLALMVFFLFYRSNMGHCDIWFFYPDFVFIFSFLKQTTHILLIFTLI